MKKYLIKKQKRNVLFLPFISIAIFCVVILPTSKLVAKSNQLSENIISTQEERNSELDAIIYSGIKLFDIKLEIENSSLSVSQDLVAKTQFISFGTVPTLVDMVYKILDTSGKVVYTESDKIIVETEQVVSKKFDNLSLNTGKYTLVLVTTYRENVTDEFKQSFEVKNVVVPKNRTIIWFLVLAVAVIGWFVAYVYKKIKQYK
jgi:hypothetical protein